MKKKSVHEQKIVRALKDSKKNIDSIVLKLEKMRSKFNLKTIHFLLYIPSVNKQTNKQKE